MVTENTTPNRGYQEPAVGNTLEVDVGRLIAALRAIDVDVADALAQIVAKAGLASPAFTGMPTAPTAAPGTDSGQLATTAFVKAALAALVDSAPGALDTLNELAAAIGDDPNFAATMAALIGTKADAAATTAALAGKADKATTVSAAGLATGGGDLSANRTITVTKATSAEMIAGVRDDVAGTPFGVKAAFDARGVRTRLARVATTGGTAFDFAIDPDATEIKVDLWQVQLSGNDTMLVQLGTSGGVVSAGYDQMAFMQVAASATLIASTAGFVVSGSTTARYANGILTLRRIGSSNRWAASYSAGNSVSMFVGGGSVDLGAAVTQLRLTRSGTNTFAAGVVAVEYRT